MLRIRDIIILNERFSKLPLLLRNVLFTYEKLFACLKPVCISAFMKIRLIKITYICINLRKTT